MLKIICAIADEKGRSSIGTASISRPVDEGMIAPKKAHLDIGAPLAVNFRSCRNNFNVMLYDVHIYSMKREMSLIG